MPFTNHYLLLECIVIYTGIIWLNKETLVSWMMEDLRLCLYIGFSVLNISKVLLQLHLSWHREPLPIHVAK